MVPEIVDNLQEFPGRRHLRGRFSRNAGKELRYSSILIQKNPVSATENVQDVIGERPRDSRYGYQREIEIESPFEQDAPFFEPAGGRGLDKSDDRFADLPHPPGVVLIRRLVTKGPLTLKKQEQYLNLLSARTREYQPDASRPPGEYLPEEEIEPYE